MRLRKWTHIAYPLDESWKFLAQEYNNTPKHFWTRRGAAKSAKLESKILGGAVRFEVSKTR